MEQHTYAKNDCYDAIEKSLNGYLQKYMTAITPN